MFGNKPNKSKFHSSRNQERTEVRECLLSFGTECSAFQFAIQKYKHKDTQNYNFTCCFVWVRQLVTYIEGGT